MPPSAARRIVPTTTHWGSYDIEVVDGRIAAVHAFDGDPEPSAIGQSFVDAVEHEARVRAPMVRKGYLEHGPRADDPGRGAEPFVELAWDDALDLVSRELARVRTAHGNEAIFAGSYGWASAGRFHHSQSHLRRFLNLFGGHVFHRNSYSLGAAHVLLPHILGDLFSTFENTTSWDTLAAHGELVVAFGGLPLKNAQVNAGGVGRHRAGAGMRRCRDAGVAFVNVSPIRDDIPAEIGAEWMAVRPHSDTALMLALAHTLLVEGLHDRAFLARYTVGFERFERYLLGDGDATAKSADWAAPLTGIDAGRIRALARRMAASRTMVAVAWSLQRADHGEQPFWAALALAAMLGRIGTPGGGIAYGYNAVHGVGNSFRDVDWASVPQGENAVKRFIPVARIADMLLNPGASYEYNGGRLVYPDIRLVYWAGGNPFHHHQDLNRLQRAWRRPETVIVHEPWWTPVARQADIVLPATTALERNDVGLARMDDQLVAMKQAIAKVGGSRDDFAIFSGLAERLGFAARYTEGRGEMEWLRHLYEVSRQRASKHGVELPDFDGFWEQGRVDLPARATPRVLLSGFRADPDANPLTTPSGRIEIHSETIAGFGYEECPGHPAWRPPHEWLGAELARRYPLHMLSNQPASRLHSQLDLGRTSRASKVADREPIRLNREDARRRGIRDGDVVRVFNDRGACLAGAVLSDDIMPGVVQLSTGAWFDPAEPARIGSLERHGNPNVLTRDVGCSRLSQGSVAQSALVEVERFVGEPPPVEAFRPPPAA